MRNLPGTNPGDQPEELPILPSGDPHAVPHPVIGEVVVQPVRKNNFTQFLIPGILLLMMLIGVFILAYGFGVDQGKRAANDERNAFYQDRIARLTGSAPLPPDASTTPGTPGTRPASSGNVQTLARVDKVEGDRITVVLLGPNGAPSGVSLVIVLGKTLQVYKSTDSAVTELRPGDNILVTGDRNGANYTARTITVLPAAG